MLVNLSQVKISNLTLPPVNMESTWAGSYEDDNFEEYWIDESRKPYLLHWAGVYWPVAVDRLLDNFLTERSGNFGQPRSKIEIESAARSGTGSAK